MGGRQRDGTAAYSKNIFLPIDKSKKSWYTKYATQTKYFELAVFYLYRDNISFFDHTHFEVSWVKPQAPRSDYGERFNSTLVCVAAI